MSKISDSGIDEQQKAFNTPRVKYIDRIKILTIGFTILFLIIWGISTKQANKPPEYDTQCVVTRVIDGDTIECDDIPVRLLSIDAPEIIYGMPMSTQPGYRSLLGLQTILSGQRLINLKLGPRLGDVYGRLLAEIFLLDGTNVQQLMIQQGHATYREIY